MNDKSSARQGFDVLFLVSILVKYRIHLLLITVFSVTLAVIFSSEAFIKPKFKSNAIVYPSNLIPYSTESPTEQMLQLFESEDIKIELIRDFDLFKHYQIDTSQTFPLTRIYAEMNENIHIDKTRFESIEIEVMDTDPKVASNMADSLIAKMHKKARAIQREKFAEVVVIYKNQMDLKKSEMDSMENALMSIRRNYGILDFEEQVNSFSRIYYTEMAAGRARIGGDRPMDKVMADLQEHGGDYMALKEHLWRIRGTYNDIKVKYEVALNDLSKELTYTNLVTRPIPAEKKSYPVRSLIVLLFTGSMLAVSLLILVLVENSKRVQSNKA